MAGRVSVGDGARISSCGIFGNVSQKFPHFEGIVWAPR
jgi:hypothetical protein